MIENFKNKNFTLLWLGQTISQFGDRINQMALIGLVAGRMPGSTFELAKLLSFTIIPVFIIGPIAGVYVDRWDRRTTLFVCDFLRGFLVLMIPTIFIFKDSMVPIYLIVFLVFCLSRFYVPAKMSIVPDLVAKKTLLSANSLVSMTGMIAFVLGCAFGGYLVEKVGARGGFFWDAATFFVSGILVFLINTRMNFHLNRRKIIDTGKEMIGEIRKSVLAEIKEGIVYLIHHKEIRFVVNMMFILMAAAGAVYVVIIVFVQQAFQSITKDLGFLAVVLGAGLFCGAILYGRFGRKVSRFKVIFSCLILGGLMMMVFAFVVQKIPILSVASSLAFLLGLIVGPIFIASNTIIHALSKDEMRGRVFSSLEFMTHLGFLLSMFLSSWLSDKMHVENFKILMGVGLVFSIVGLISLLQHKNNKFDVLRGV
ncbi:MAG: MFS transporter [Candidatus Aceula lacicola]|nr:MFS transporter [Candidatus Aceula lacicola]